MEFKKKVLVIGYGSVSKCTLPILFKHIRIPYKNVTVIDFADKRKELRGWIAKGVKYYQEKITPMNLGKVLGKYVSSGGLIIDLAWNISCIDILTWCHDNQVLSINTSVEEWDPYANIHNKSPLEKSLYYRQMELRQVTSKWHNSAITAVVDHGANPGLISHFTKKGIEDIAKKAIADRTTKRDDAKLL